MVLLSTIANGREEKRIETVKKGSITYNINVGGMIYPKKGRGGNNGYQLPER